MKLLLWPLGVLVSAGRGVLQAVPLALGQVWASKSRAALTALGIVIGVASVIAVSGAMTGMERHVISQFEEMGATRMSAWPNRPNSVRNQISWRDVIMGRKEAEAIRDRSQLVRRVTPVGSEGFDIRYKAEVAQGANVLGIWPDWHEIEGRPVRLGRPFVRIDEEEARPVCLVNEAAFQELGLPTDPVGEALLIGDRRFTIVGVVEDSERSARRGRDSSRTEVFVPFAALELIDRRVWATISAQIVSTDLAADAVEEVRFILRNARNLRGDFPDTFEISVVQDAIERAQETTKVVRVIALAIVSISLLVGGIGIMNIMLVSVSERTREIGLRKALGARPAVVLGQFLVEATFLCLVGGAIGVAAGYGVTELLSNIDGVPLGGSEVPRSAVYVSLGFSAGVGIVFGMFPAIKAASLNPIEALRHE